MQPRNVKWRHFCREIPPTAQLHSIIVEINGVRAFRAMQHNCICPQILVSYKSKSEESGVLCDHNCNVRECLIQSIHLRCRIMLGGDELFYFRTQLPGSEFSAKWGPDPEGHIHYDIECNECAENNIFKGTCLSVILLTAC
jgi:hypothetical protein